MEWSERNKKNAFTRLCTRHTQDKAAEKTVDDFVVPPAKFADAACDDSFIHILHSDNETGRSYVWRTCNCRSFVLIAFVRNSPSRHNAAYIDIKFVSKHVVSNGVLVEQIFASRWLYTIYIFYLVIAFLLKTVRKRLPAVVCFKFTLTSNGLWLTSFSFTFITMVSIAHFWCQFI